MCFGYFLTLFVVFSKEFSIYFWISPYIGNRTQISTTLVGSKRLLWRENWQYEYQPISLQILIHYRGVAKSLTSSVVYNFFLSQSCLKKFSLQKQLRKTGLYCNANNKFLRIKRGIWEFMVIPRWQTFEADAMPWQTVGIEAPRAKDCGPRSH